MKWGTIRVTHKTYSVPSRLQGHEVEVRQYTDHLEVYYQGHLTAQLARLHGEQSARIDYRHIIWSLMRKPGAFARYRFREHLFPTETFKEAYEALSRWRGERADIEYVRILHLAASTHGVPGGAGPETAPGSGETLRLRCGAGPGDAGDAPGPLPQFHPRPRPQAL